jgi:hypothetical protein
MKEQVEETSSAAPVVRRGLPPGSRFRARKSRYKFNKKFYKVDPAVRRELFTCRLPAYILWWLEKQVQSCGVIVEEALLAKYAIDCDEIVGVPPEREKFLSPENWCDSEVLDELVKECNASGECL